MALQGGKVLVVDDEPLIGELLCQVLEIGDFESRGVMEGQEGIRQARDWLPHAVVLDVMLPDTDGFEVCRTLKQDERTAEIGVLMLTALQGHANRVRGFQAGADRFLTKPFHPAELVRELDSLVSEYKEHRSVGLRRLVEFKFLDAADHEQRIEELLLDLTRISPLSPSEIEGIGASLREIGQRVMRDPNDGEAPLCIDCRVLRDRVEWNLRSDPMVAEAQGRWRSLLEIDSHADANTLIQPICDALETFEDREIVITRWFNWTKHEPS